MGTHACQHEQSHWDEIESTVVPECRSFVEQTSASTFFEDSVRNPEQLGDFVYHVIGSITQHAVESVRVRTSDQDCLLGRVQDMSIVTSGNRDETSSNADEE